MGIDHGATEGKRAGRLDGDMAAFRGDDVRLDQRRDALDPDATLADTLTVVFPLLLVVTMVMFVDDETFTLTLVLMLTVAISLRPSALAARWAPVFTSSRCLISITVAETSLAWIFIR